MESGRRVGQRPDCHTFLCKFWHFQLAVSQWKLAWLTPNLGILWISLSSFWLCESIVANPIIYRLVPRPSRFETRQLNKISLTLNEARRTIFSPSLSAYFLEENLEMFSFWQKRRTLLTEIPLVIPGHASFRYFATSLWWPPTSKIVLISSFFFNADIAAI